MKKSKLLFPLLSGVGLLAIATPLVLKANEPANETAVEEIAYQTDFEGMTINKNSTPDINTGFVWCQNWQDTNTVARNNSTMLETKLANSNEYAPVGGFGIASKSNLSKCKNGEAYTCSCYLEFSGLHHLFVEAVGDKWGSVILYPDGSIKDNPGGNNITNVTYENNILTFTFTKTYHSAASVEGYIQFTGYQANNAVVYFDDIKIKRAENIIEEHYDNLPLGVFTNSTDIQNKIWLESSKVTSEYVKEGNNTVAKMTYAPTSTEKAALFYINKMAGLNLNRDYKVSFDYKTNNISSTTVILGGTYVSEINSFDIDSNYAISNIKGNKISNVKYENGKISFDLNTAVKFAEYTQFEFCGAPTSLSNATYTIDNVIVKQLPTIESLSAATGSVKKTYYIGDELNTTGLIVTAYFTDNSSKVLNSNEYQISGFDSSTTGKQAIVITYNGKSVSYKIDVLKKLIELSIDTTNCKKEFAFGEEFDATGLVVSASFEGADSEEIHHNAFTGGYSISCGGFDSRKPGTYTITIAYRNQEKSYTVKVLERSTISFDVDYEETGKE